ncbi:phage holin family protein [Blastomonas aquatica]|nr:phage holin family protein [Blastomonas aquatica]
MTQVYETAPVSDTEPPVEEAPKPGMIAQLRGLYADGRELIDAEIGFQKARIAAVGQQVRAMAILAIIGLVLISCALIALVVGTMIALIPVLGAWGAMAATVAGSLLLAVLCLWAAAGRIGKISAMFAGDPEPDAGLPPETGANGAVA